MPATSSLGSEHCRCHWGGAACACTIFIFIFFLFLVVRVVKVLAEGHLDHRGNRVHLAAWKLSAECDLWKSWSQTPPQSVFSLPTHAHAYWNARLFPIPPFNGWKVPKLCTNICPQCKNSPSVLPPHKQCIHRCQQTIVASYNYWNQLHRNVIYVCEL